MPRSAQVADKSGELIMSNRTRNRVRILGHSTIMIALATLLAAISMFFASAVDVRAMLTPEAAALRAEARSDARGDPGGMGLARPRAGFARVHVRQSRAAAAGLHRDAPRPVAPPRGADASAQGASVAGVELRWVRAARARPAGRFSSVRAGRARRSPPQPASTASRSCGPPSRGSPSPRSRPGAPRTRRRGRSRASRAWRARARRSRA